MSVRELFEIPFLPPPSFAKATDGKPSGLLSVDFFCPGKNKRSETERAKDALQSLGDGGLYGDELEKNMFYTYILRSINHPNHRYTGVTEDLQARLAIHNAGEEPRTSKFKPWRIQTAIAFDNKKKAVAFEDYLKTGSGREFSKRHF